VSEQNTTTSSSLTASGGGTAGTGTGSGSGGSTSAGGSHEPSTLVDLFVSVEKIMVLNTDLQVHTTLSITTY